MSIQKYDDIANQTDAEIDANGHGTQPAVKVNVLSDKHRSVHAERRLLQGQQQQRLSEDDDSGSELFVEMGPGLDGDTLTGPGNDYQSNEQVQQHAVDTRSDPRHNIGVRAHQSTVYH